MHFRRANLASANAKLIFTTLLEISSSNPSHAPAKNVCAFSDAGSGSSNVSICNTAFEGWKCTPLNRKLYISRFFTFVTSVWDPIRCIAKTHLQDVTLEGGEMRLAHVQFAEAVTIAPPFSYRENFPLKPHFWPILLGNNFVSSRDFWHSEEVFSDVSYVDVLCM